MSLSTIKISIRLDYGFINFHYGNRGLKRVCKNFYLNNREKLNKSQIILTKVLKSSNHD